MCGLRLRSLLCGRVAVCKRWCTWNAVECCYAAHPPPRNERSALQNEPSGCYQAFQAILTGLAVQACLHPERNTIGDHLTLEAQHGQRPGLSDLTT